MAKYKSIESFSLSKRRAESLAKFFIGNNEFNDLPAHIADRVLNVVNAAFIKGIDEGAQAIVDGKLCDECFGTGVVTHVTPAHVEAGNAVDEDSREVNCINCS